MNLPEDDLPKAIKELPSTIKELTSAIVRSAYFMTGRKRCEDVITAAAAYAGECVMRQAGDFDFDRHTWNPGKPIFSLKVTQLLSGDRGDWREIPETSVFGFLRGLLIKHPRHPYPPECFPDIGSLYRRYSAARQNGVSQGDWGKALLSVPASHYPSEGMLALRAAFELRKFVDRRWGDENLSVQDVSLMAKLTMMKLLLELQQYIAPEIAVLLAFETINAMSKTAPFLPKHMGELVNAYLAKQVQLVQ
jgi:hypothetical protein